MQKKIFTPQEATDRLPLIRKIVQDILQKGQQLKGLSLLSPTPLVEKDFKCKLSEIKILIEEVEELGCLFKDWNFEIGLVDFPSMINGQEVFLCWRSDEPELKWFHGTDEGYQARKLIPNHLIS